MKQIERKLIIGGENMLEKTEKQARLLEESNAELERGRLNETHLRQALAEKNQERWRHIFETTFFSLLIV